MTITINLDAKSKQVIKTNPKFTEQNKTFGEQYRVGQTIAHDIAKGKYDKFEIHE